MSRKPVLFNKPQNISVSTMQWYLLMSTLTAYLTQNTCLSAPRLRYLIPKINTHQLSSFAELCYCYCYLIKSLPAAKLPRVYWHTLTTDWLPAPLRTRHCTIRNPHNSKKMAGKNLELCLCTVPEHGGSFSFVLVRNACDDIKLPRERRKWIFATYANSYL